jgi:polysaccharide deacetylase 2 family uncharacterized protein YibQ
VSRFALVFWSIVGALGAVAIVSGIVSNARIAARNAPHRKAAIARPSSSPSPGVRATAAVLGSDWNVVVDRSPAPDADGSARVAIAVGPCGANATLDAAFARLDLPMALVIDPNGADARTIAALAGSAGKPFYLQVGSAPTAVTLAALRQRFDGMTGIASGQSSGVAAALAGSGLAYFDERGNADARTFARAGVGLISRDVTVDDRDQAGYVTYMLQRTIVLGAARGRAVAWMHPRVSSLHALRAFGTASSRDLVGFAPE